MIIVDGKLFTQEQHGKDEALICCDAATGDQLWEHEDKATQFWDGQAGSGPRATPTFVDGKLYTFGGTGRLNCLDAATGKVKWSRDVAGDNKTSVPMWGFREFAAGLRRKSHRVFRGKQQKHRYRRPMPRRPANRFGSTTSGQVSYCSAQLASLDGQNQILFVTDEGVIGVDPANGTACWNYDAPGHGMWRAVQPTPVGEQECTVRFGGSGIGVG